jgi:ribosome-associated toxin RatA of RatAB toxin-antitoxin module
MGKANISGVFKAPIKKVFEVVSDYSKYPEFLPEVKRVSIIDASQPERKLVEMELSVIKSFRYQVWITSKPFTEVQWKFHSGDLFKDNTGGWRLKDLGDGTTHVEYYLEVKFGLFVPGMIEKALIEVNLPGMLESYRKRCES